MAIVLFEDELVSRLDPVAVGKPAFSIHCGGYSLLEILAGWEVAPHLLVRDHLREIVAADFPQFAQKLPPNDQPALWLNARAVPSVELLTPLRKLLAAGQGAIVHAGEDIAAAILPAGTRLESEAAQDVTAALARLELPQVEVSVPLFEFGHDVIRHHLTTLGGNLAHRLLTGSYEQRGDGVFLAPGAVLGEYLVTDTRR